MVVLVRCHLLGRKARLSLVLLREERAIVLAVVPITLD